MRMTRPSSHRPRRTAIALGTCLLGVIVSGLALVDLVTPAVEATRFRNSLIASVATTEDLQWDYSRPPKSFRVDEGPVPGEFIQTTADMETYARSQSGQLDEVIVDLIKHLRQAPKQRGPIQSSTSETYRLILDSGRGYCADYTQVFNGLALAGGLGVREWGMSFDRFSGDGHAFNEVFDPVRRRWVFADPFHAFLVEDSATGNLLSALEWRERLIAPDGRSTVEIIPIEDRYLFSSHEAAFHYYQRGADQFYLWFANDVFSYDAHPLLAALEPFSRAATQIVAILIGAHPEIRIVQTANNRQEIEALFQFRLLVLASLLLIFMFLAGTLASAISLFWRRRGGDASGLNGR